MADLQAVRLNSSYMFFNIASARVRLRFENSMDFRAKQIAPPRDWAVFEDLCLAVFRAEWNDPLAQKNGRAGQPQHGVDIYGSPLSQRDIVYGVQCKGKNQNYASRTTVSEFKAELVKAEQFMPSLTHWIFATSARKDEKLQQAARELSAERISKGLFPVTALGWEDIQSILALHPDVVQDFYPEHAYDIAGLLKSLRDLPSGDEVRELRQQIKRLNDARRSALPRHEDPRWDLVSFAGQRDLGPALLGRGLGPGDASACPRLEEADMIVAQLRRAFFARLVGGPGSGKSVCAYQVAADFAAAGWSVRRVRDASAIDDLSTIPRDDLCLLLIDDAHLMPRVNLEQIEETADARRLVLSIHNGVEDGSVIRGAIVIDSKRAVRTIAAELLARPEQTLAAVRRADNDVDVGHIKEPLERRIDHAAAHSDRPWQFCFVLGGGWKRAKEAADAARAARADLVLAAVGIIQLASRDAPLAPTSLIEFCAQNGIAPDDVSRSISWLVAQRLLLSDADCRCPHQRFALVVLGRILDGQDDKGRAIIGRMLAVVARDASYPIAGLRILLHELRFLGDYRRWAGLVPPEALEPLIARSWIAASADDRAFAALLFSDLDSYIENWFQRIQEHHILTVADWITNAAPPTGYGLFYLLNALRNNLPSAAAAIVEAVDAKAIADILSHVTPDTADHGAELIRTIGWERSDAWKARFNQTFDREAAITLARKWPGSAPLYGFARFCAALDAWDNELGLTMVEAFIPTAQKAFADDPVSAFQKLEEIAGHVLRLSDPLGVYRGKLAPDRRRFSLGRLMCTALKPKILAAQLSATARRDFQDATFFLAFLKKAFKSKFDATVAEIDWAYVARTIGDNWTSLSHEAEIFLTVSYSSKKARVLITETVEQNLYRIEDFSPRVAIMMPEVAIRHICAGKRIRLSQHSHFEFQFSAALVAQLVQLRSDLVEPLLAPFEASAGKALSGENASWFRRADLFIEVLGEAAPASLQRVLSAIDVAKAESGWIDALQKPGRAQDAVASLIESALLRPDAIGVMARRLRKKFPRRSIPKKRKRRWRDED